MKIVLFGATGMVGSGVLEECLADTGVTAVLVIGRNACGVQDKKLDEIIHRDFFDYAAVEKHLRGYDACFFCLGVSSAGMAEEKYHHLTYELTVKAGETLAALNPDLTFCYVSGVGADSTEQGRVMWARVRGMTENHLLRLPFKAAYVFRPAYIHPVKGVRSKTTLYRAFYAVLAPLYPVLRRVFPNQVTTTENIGLAMLRVVEVGSPTSVIYSRGMNALASAKAT